LSVFTITNVALCLKVQYAAVNGYRCKLEHNNDVEVYCDDFRLCITTAMVELASVSPGVVHWTLSSWSRIVSMTSRAGDKHNGLLEC